VYAAAGAANTKRGLTERPDFIVSFRGDGIKLRSPEGNKQVKYLLPADERRDHADDRRDEAPYQDKMHILAEICYPVERGFGDDLRQSGLDYCTSPSVEMCH
jgi:hypothetical protein